MTITTTPSLVDSLRQYQLLAPEQLDDVTRNLQRRFPDPKQLARELVRRGWLTAYQVNQLFQGKGSDLLLGQYVLLERVGEGGMGQVFKARHPKMARVVALKIIRKDRLANPQVSKRFEQEIRAAAQLAHPNVVTAYDAAQVGDVHLLVMEYVEGIDLAQMVRDSGPLPVEQACAYILQAALGLQHAHEKGMVHRDIKPSNLLLAVKEGTVKILDMGLARLPSDAAAIDDTSPLTEHGAVMGTPDYAAPEQIRQAQSADIRSDLYSLGCTLYFLLTGRPPFPGGSVGEKLVKHQLDEPERVEKLNPEVPAGLSALVRKLMAKRPEDRFATPEGLVNVLDAGLQTGQWPISASAAPTARFRAFRPTTVGPSPPETSIATRIAASLAPSALLNSPLARKGREQFGRLQQTPTGQRWLRLKGRGGAVLLGLFGLFLLWLFLPDWGPPLNRLKPRHVSSDDRMMAGQPDGLVAVIGEQRMRHWAQARCVAISPDGKVVASGGEDGALRLWDAATGNQLYALPHGGIVAAVAFLLNGKRVATYDGNSGNLKLWDTATGKSVPAPPGRTIGWFGDVVAMAPPSGGPVKLWQLTTGQERTAFEGQPNYPYGMSFTPNGQLAAAGDDAGTVWVWEVATGKLRHTLKGQAKGYIPRVQLTADGKFLAFGDARTSTLKLWDLAADKEQASFPAQTGLWALAADGKAMVIHSPDANYRLWDVAAGRERATLRHPAGRIGVATFSPDGQLLATGTGAGSDTIKLWDVATGAERPPFKGSTGPVAALSFSGDGKTLASASADGCIKLWDLATGSERPLGTDRPDWYTSAAFSPDGKMLALVTRDHLVKLWDPAKAKERAVLHGHKGQILSMVFSPDSQTLATASFDGSARLWDVVSGQLQASLNHGGGYAVGVVGFTPDGKMVASLDAISVKLWEPVNGQPRTTFPVPRGGQFSSMALSADSKMVAVGSDGGGLIHLWDLSTGKEQSPLQVSKATIASVAWTADGQLLAAKERNGSLKLWDVAANKERASLAPCNHWLLSPDSRTVAVSGPGDDGQLRVWDLATGQVKATLEGHTKRVESLAFAPDGQLLASAGQDGRIIVWDPASRKRWFHAWQLPGPVQHVAFAPDGRHLATTNGNGTVYIFRVSALSK